MTVDQNNPAVQVLYCDTEFPTFTNITQYVKEFTRKNSGILKTMEATVFLNNKDGRFTLGGDLEIQKYGYLKLKADVRGVVDNLFFGTVETRNSRSIKKQEELTITCLGHLQRLLQDLTTKQYLMENEEKTQSWTMKTMIEHMIEHPDSGYDTGVRLTTDSGDITTVAAKHNFDREWLLDAVNKCCENIGYTGFE